VNLAPVLPGLTDSPESIEAVVRAAADHGARFLGSQVVYLMPGTREHFLGFLQAEYPQLHAEYQRLFAGSYAPPPVQQKIQHAVRDLKRTYALVEKEAEPESLRPFQQLALGL
jgi:DNA repair photolyase